MEGNEDESLVSNIVSATRFSPADVLDISQAGADIYWYTSIFLFSASFLYDDNYY
jgi:hypothetical protein